MPDAPHGPLIFGLEDGGGGGGPPLCDAAPPEVNPDNVAAPGVSPDASRCDHVHALPAEIPVDLEAGTAASSEGVAAAVARADHVHALPAMTVPDDVDSGAASVGVSTEVARGDHKHALAIPIFDEAVLQGAAHTFDFTGLGVLATVAGGVARVTVPATGFGPPVRALGTTVAPTAPAAFAVIPEMTAAFTPVGTRAWVNFESSMTFAPAATGAAIAVEIRIRVAGVPVPGSDRTAGFTSDLIIGLVPGLVGQLVSYRRLLTGLAPGVPVTIDVEWRELPAATAGVVTALGTERSLTLEDSS